MKRIATLIFALFIIFSATGIAQNQSAFPNRIYPNLPPGAIGPSSPLLKMADMNQDGDADAVAIHYQHVSVQLGDGAGGFGSIQYANGVLQPLAFALGDMNNDGKMDVVESSFPGTIVGILFGNGLGGLISPITAPTLQYPIGVGIGDFDADGNADLAIVNEIAAMLHIKTGNGAGGFTTDTFYAVPDIFPRYIEVGDFNNDNDPDFAVSCDTSIQIFLGSAGPLLIPAPPIAYALHTMSSGDFNNDGFQDLVAGTENGLNGTTNLFLSDGLGNFTLAWSDLNNSGAGSIIVHDLNNDGFADFASAHETSLNGSQPHDEVRIYHGDGMGMLQMASTVVVPSRTRSVAGADLNQDGFVDIITGSVYDVSFAKPYLNDGTGAFPVVQQMYNVPEDPLDVDSVDMNLDGTPDIVTCSYSSGRISVSTTDGAGGFLSYYETAPTNLLRRLALGDFNNDGMNDVAATRTGSFGLIRYFGNGDGTLGNGGVFDAGPYPSGITTLDFNNDGNLDLVISNINPTVTKVLRNNGSGGFVVHETINNSSPVFNLASADVDLDGDADFAMVNTGNNTVSLFKNNLGTPVFAPPISFSSPGTLFAIAFGDVRVNGAPEMIITMNDNAPKVIVRVNNGTGSFLLSASYPAAGNSGDPICADFNNDSIPDVAVAGGSTVSVLFSDGTGSLTNLQAFTAGSGINAITSGDYNSDGWRDLACASALGSTVSTLYNTHPHALGIEEYGASSPGCSGPQVLTTNLSPKIGQANFQFRCLNAPQSSLGVLLVTDSQQIPGFDMFGIGVDIHVDFTLATEIYGLDMLSDAAGLGITPAPLPNVPSIVNNSYYAQAIWIWPAAACTLPPLNASASNALSIVILP